jgi:hypothetical protein
MKNHWLRIRHQKKTLAEATLCVPSGLARFKGKFQEADPLNRGRCYPYACMVQEYLKKGNRNGIEGTKETTEA